MQDPIALINAAAARQKVKQDPLTVYLSHDGAPYFKVYAQVVGRFQEGFLQDKVCRDLDDAFARAVMTAERLLPSIKAKVGA